MGQRNNNALTVGLSAAALHRHNRFASFSIRPVTPAEHELMLSPYAQAHSASLLTTPPATSAGSSSEGFSGDKRAVQKTDITGVRSKPFQRATRNQHRQKRRQSVFDEVIGGGYKCGMHYHFPVDRAVCAKTYELAMQITARGGERVFWVSAERRARDWQVDERTVRRGDKELVRLGFFEPLDATPFQSNRYLVITHEQWAKRHPGKCLEREVMPWSDEVQDGLAVTLHKASRGRMKFFNRHIQSLRSHGLDDERLAAACAVYADFEDRKKQPMKAASHFCLCMKTALGNEAGRDCEKKTGGHIALEVLLSFVHGRTGAQQRDLLKQAGSLCKSITCSTDGKVTFRGRDRAIVGLLLNLGQTVEQVTLAWNRFYETIEPSDGELKRAGRMFTGAEMVRVRSASDARRLPDQ